MLRCLLLPGCLAVDVLLRWLPPSVVPVLVSLLPNVDPVLVPTHVVFESVGHPQWGSCLRARPSRRVDPSLQGSLPGEAPLLLAESDTALIHVRLLHPERLTKTVRRSNPLLTSCLWWHNYVLMAGYWRPRRRNVRSVDLWQPLRTTTYMLPLHINCPLPEHLRTSWPTSNLESPRHHLGCDPVSLPSFFSNRVSVAASSTSFRAKN